MTVPGKINALFRYGIYKKSRAAVLLYPDTDKLFDKLATVSSFQRCPFYVL